MAAAMLPLLYAAMALAPVAAMPTRSTSDLSQRQSVLPASKHCGDSDSVILPNTPWIVFNMFYNHAQSVGTQCTNYNTVSTSASGAKQVEWSSVTDIEYVQAT